jgi:3-phenylpropionate/trans-cinnamate dioxygenase ferredoxin reductase subunit
VTELPTGLESIAIVGAGPGGVRVAVELRRLGFAGDVALIGAESEPPYSRPPLSKEVLHSGDPAPVPVKADLADVELLLGRTATGLDTWGVCTDRGPVSADAVVIATGATPVRLPGAGRQRVLRTYGDALALRGELRPGSRLVIIGASWIGAEVATSALRRGCHVTCLEAGPSPLHVALGPDVGSRTRAWWQGVDLRLDTPARSVEDDGVLLADWTLVPADVVLTCVGARPEVDWLARSGLCLDGGVRVDHRLLAELDDDHPWAGRIGAVGDVARWPSRRFGSRIRVEHWDHAAQSGRTLAAALLGDASVVHDPVPFFWSEQFGHRLQYVGHHDTTSAALIRRYDDGAWGAGWLRPDGSLCAYLTVDRPRDLPAAQSLIASGEPVSAQRLLDPGLALSGAAT